MTMEGLRLAGQVALVAGATRGAFTSRPGPAGGARRA